MKSKKIKNKESKEPDTIKKVLEKHLKEIKNDGVSNRVLTDDQKWTKYKKDKKEKAKQMKAIKNAGKFVSSKNKKFEEEWNKRSDKNEDKGKIRKIRRVDW